MTIIRRLAFRFLFVSPSLGYFITNTVFYLSTKVTNVHVIFFIIIV